MTVSNYLPDDSPRGKRIVALAQRLATVFREDDAPLNEALGALAICATSALLSAHDDSALEDFVRLIETGLANAGAKTN